MAVRLLAIEELRATCPALSLAAHGGSLLARIRRIAGCEPAPRLAGGGSILCAILVSIAIFAAVAWAATPTTKKAQQTPEETAKDSVQLGDTPWGEPLMGLRSRLTVPDGTEYRQGRPVTLLVEIKNVSEKPVPFSVMTRPTVLLQTLGANGPWLGSPGSVIGVSPWEGRKGTLLPGAILAWKIPLSRLRFSSTIPAGTEITFCAVGPVQNVVHGKLPFELTSNQICLTFKDEYAPAMKAADLLEKWSRSMTFVYRYEPGIFDPEGRGVNSLEVDGDGRACMVMRYGGPHAWSHEKGDPHEARKKLLPEGRTEAKLSQERLDQLAKLLHDQQAWKLRQFEAIANTDEPEIRVCVVSEPASVIGTFPMHVIRPQPAIAAIQREAESLMKDVVAASAGGPRAPLTEQEIAARWPDTVLGRVTDAQGMPIEGATVRAHSGMGTLLQSGIAETGKDGRYTLRYAGSGRASYSVTAFFANKPGFAEKSRDGSGNYVLVPAPTVEIELVDGEGRPIAKRGLCLTGERLPPACNALDSGVTDRQGLIRFKDVPPTFGCWFYMVVGPHREIRTPSLRFSQPEKYRVQLCIRRDKGTGLDLLEVESVKNPLGQEVRDRVVVDEPLACTVAAGTSGGGARNLGEDRRGKPLLAQLAANGGPQLWL